MRLPKCDHTSGDSWVARWMSSWRPFDRDHIDRIIFLRTVLVVRVSRRQSSSHCVAILDPHFRKTDWKRVIP